MQSISSPPQANAEVVINENFVTLQHQQVYGIRQPVTTGLTWGYYGGRWGGFSVADGTLTLTNSATNYIVVAIATGAISVSTSSTNWNNATDYVRVYQLTTAGGVVTAVQDHRAGPGGIFGGGGGGGGAADFTDLGDVPSSYTGEAGKFVRVNGAENGLEFGVPAGAGDVIGPGSSTDNTLPRFDGSGGDTLQGSGVLVSDDDEISGYRAHLNQQTGTSYTLQASDCGKLVELANGAAIALTAPNSLPAGFNCMIVQGGVGQVTVASTGSGTVVNRQSQFKTAGQNAMCSIYVRSNSGTNAVWVFGGDTAA